MTKSQLRKVYLDKRAKLNEAEVTQRNFQLYQNFFTHIDLSFSKVLHAFLPIIAKHEPDTWPILDRLRREYPHIRISVPRINDQTGELEHFYFEGLHQLITNTWGIQEPRHGIPTPVDKIDVVLVPLLAFDIHGNRIGYGKGYYDRFLKQCPVQTKKVGISFFPPLELIPAEPYDVKLDACLTCDHYYEF